MGWNRNVEKVITAALAVESGRSIRPWSAADLIEFLDEEDGSDKPSDATVYRLLHELDDNLGLVSSTVDLDPNSERTPGRPRRSYRLTPAGIEAARNAAGWLGHAGVSWAHLAIVGSTNKL